MDRTNPDTQTSSTQGSRTSKRSRSARKHRSRTPTTDDPSSTATPAGERTVPSAQRERELTADYTNEQSTKIKRSRASKRGKSIAAPAPPQPQQEEPGSTATPATERTAESAQRERERTADNTDQSGRSKKSRSSKRRHSDPAPQSAQPHIETSEKEHLEPQRPGEGPAKLRGKEAEQRAAAVSARPSQPGPSKVGELREGARPKPPSRHSNSAADLVHSDEKKEQRHRLFGVGVVMVLSLTTVFSVLVLMVLLNAWDNDVVVRVPGLGAFLGLRTYVEGRPVYVFRGIPFGESPAGASRFAKPTVSRMDSKTVMDTRSSRPGCVQIPYFANGRVIRRNEDTSEDCLHLNVWTPCTEKTEAGCRKTVLVFFHGQSFQEGDNNYYDGKWLAGLGQVVVVAPNFRLGAFGFLNLGCPENRGWSANDLDCAPGDVGLDDQRLAVEWVVANIGSFGGNSKDIVLVGSGSGAWSVGAHILGASARGTSDQFWNNARFTKVILMSDSPLKRSFPARSHALSARLGCSSDDVAEELRCMRNKTARDILDRTREPEDYLGPSVVATPARARQVSGGRFFIGTVSNEGSHLADTVKRATSGQGDMTTSVANFLNTTYGLVVPLQVYDAYRNSSAFFHGGVVDEEWWMSQLMGDIRFTCPLLTLGQELASVDENKVFGYVFDHRASFALFNHTAGAPRFSELDFVFGVPLDGSRHATPEEERLSRTVIDIWSGFARTGSLPLVNGKPWPTYTRDKVVPIRIKQGQFEEVPDYKKENCTIVGALSFGFMA